MAANERSKLLKKTEEKKKNMFQEGQEEQQTEEFVARLNDDQEQGSVEEGEQTQSNNNSNEGRNKKGLRRFLSNIGRIKRYSWRRLSRNESGTFTDSTFADDLQSEQRSDFTRMEDDTEENAESDHGDNGGGDDNMHFLKFFFTARGPPQIALLSMLYALSIGSTVGVVPAVLTERYAVMHHGFEGQCAEYGKHEKPEACLDGSSDAQAAAAAASFVSNTATFLTSSLIGALSDEYGRRSEFSPRIGISFSLLWQLFGYSH